MEFQVFPVKLNIICQDNNISINLEDIIKESPQKINKEFLHKVKEK